MERVVRAWPVEEGQLRAIGLFSGVGTIFSAIATGTLGFMLSIGWDTAISPDADVKKLGIGVLVVCGVVVVASTCIACWAFWQRKTEVDRIITPANR